MDKFTAILTAAFVVFLGLTQAGHAEDSTNTKALKRHPAKALANAYHIDGWDQIEKIEFTFNVNLPAKDKTVSRQWTWRPGKSFTLHGPDGTGHAVRFKPGTTELSKRIGEAKNADKLRAAHKHFINDSYWLVFGFEPLWSNPKTNFKAKAKPPIKPRHGAKRKPMAKLLVTYPDQGGYTPGDAYTLYLDPQSHRIRQWTYHPGGLSKSPKGMSMTWQKDRRLGPIILSLNHWGPKRKFHLWFTDVRATLSNGQTLKPKPIK